MKAGGEHLRETTFVLVTGLDATPEPKTLPIPLIYHTIMTSTNDTNFVIDAFHVDLCHARLMGEVATEEDKNYTFQERNGGIWLQATKPIINGERLRGRY